MLAEIVNRLLTVDFSNDNSQQAYIENQEQLATFRFLNFAGVMLSNRITAMLVKTLDPTDLSELNPEQSNFLAQYLTESTVLVSRYPKAFFNPQNNSSKHLYSQNFFNLNDEFYFNLNHLWPFLAIHSEDRLTLSLKHCVDRKVAILTLKPSDNDNWIVVIASLAVGTKPSDKLISAHMIRG